MKDFEKATDPAADAAQSVLKPRGHSPAKSPDAPRHDSHPSPPSHADAAALNAPELSHPANAAPLAELLTQLQQSHGNVHVQRVVAEMNEARSDAATQPSSSGNALDSNVKTEMESAFGENFGDVRVHTDAQAEKTSEELGARAVTHGRDIYFGSGEYKPSTREGKELLAHELAHVVQQKGRLQPEAQRDSVGQSGDEHEQEADRAASAILMGARPAIMQRGATPAFQRQGHGTRPQPHRADAGTDAGPAPGAYVREVILTGVDSSADLGPNGRYLYLHDRVGPGYTVRLVVWPPLHLLSLRSTIDYSFERIAQPGGEMFTVHVTGQRARQISLWVRYNEGRRNIDVRFDFPIRP